MSAAEPPTPMATSNVAVLSEEIQQLILCLADENLRDQALVRLCSREELLEYLGPYLWFSFRTIAMFLEEIVSAYRLLSPPSSLAAPDKLAPEKLAVDQFARIRRILLLLQCVAFHPDTKLPMLQAQITAYLHPFLGQNSSGSQVLEDLRHLSLGVIAALLIEPDTNVMEAVLSTNVVPLVLSSMEIGGEASKTTATLILCRVLLVCPEYICLIQERLVAVNNMLAKVVISLVQKPSARLYLLVIKCYLRLSEDKRGVLLLRKFCPSRLVNEEIFRPYWEQDKETRLSRQLLIDNIVGSSSV